MRIAFIGQKGLPATSGGVESHVERLALGLVARGHQVIAYARPWYVNRQVKMYRGIFMIYKHSWRTKNWDTATHVWRASWDVVHRDVDIIHYHGVGPALFAWIPRLFNRNAKIIVTFHAIDRLHKKWGWFARLMLRLGEVCAVWFAHETITVSKAMQSYVKKTYHEDTIYVPSGIDAPAPLKPRLIKEQFGLCGSDYILFLARLIPVKGPEYLIEAYNQLKTDKKLVIAGGGLFTELYASKLKRLASTNHNIIFTGEPKKGSTLWRELFSNAYVYVLPSESEGFPMSLLEAMSFERCVLVSNIPACKEIVQGGFGFTFKTKNAESLRNNLRWLLDHPGTVGRVGKAAAQHVLKKYRWDDVVQVTEHIYACVIRFEGKKLRACVRFQS